MVEGSFRGQQEPLEDDRIRCNRKTARRWKGEWKTAGSSRRRQNPLKGGRDRWRTTGASGRYQGQKDPLEYGRGHC